MDEKKSSREEKILKICEAMKAQSDSETAQDNLLLGGLRMAYDHGYADGAASA